MPFVLVAASYHISLRSLTVTMTLSAQYAHWHQFFENISISSQVFYKSLEEELTARKVPETATSRVDFLEGGPISARRIYLQVRRDWLTYHICVAPFGTGFFVSSRLIVSPWNTWPVMLGIAAAMIFGMFVFFGITAEVFNNGAMAFFATLAMAFPAAFLFFLILVVWIILCLRMTYYRLDTMLAFHEAVHGLLVAKINHVMEASGRKPLSDEQSKPILHRLLRR